MREKQVTDVMCCKCRRLLKKKIRWFSVNQKQYFCLAVCPEHGYVKGKLRIKRSEDGSVFAVQTVKLTDEAGVELLVHRCEEAKKKRAERAKAKKEMKKEREEDKDSVLSLLFSIVSTSGAVSGRIPYPGLGKNAWPLLRQTGGNRNGCGRI